MDKYSILKQYYGHSAFRAGQEELIDSILSGRDALCVMPTGGGKSLCYQIPALLLPGITLVVSPLISLMKDQVAALKSAGVPAAYINSSLTSEQIRTVYARTRKGAYKLIYVAPERLETNSFLSLMQEMDVSFLAVDEAHCISQWGQDFRPSYLGIVDFINALPRRPIVAAYTATATKQVQSDILRLLQLQSPYRIVTGFDRPNLYFDVRRPKTSFPPSPHSLTSEEAEAVSSTVQRARRSSACATACVTAASPPRAITRASQMRSGSRIRTIFSLTARPSWSRRTPSAWASTSQTSASSSITTCRKARGLLSGGGPRRTRRRECRLRPALRAR